MPTALAHSPLRSNATASLAAALDLPARLAPRQFELRRRKAYQAVIDGRWVDAEQLFNSLEADPRLGVQDWLALATSRLRLGHYEGAHQAAQLVLCAEPGHVKAAHLASLALMSQHRWAEALRLFERHAAGPARQHYPFVANHGTALAALGRAREAVPVFLEAMVLDISDPSVHMKLALALRDLKLYEESAESFLTALALDPKRLAARLMALHMRQHACQWRGFEAARAELVEALADESDDAGSLGEGGVFTLVAIEHPTPLFKHAAAQVAMRHAQVQTPLPRRSLRHLPAPGQGRVRLGYVSNDLYNHATAMLLVESLEQRDRERFEVTLYSHSSDDGSAMQRRIRAACEHFVDISCLSDAEAALRVHADQIDLLVDLKGHTLGNRLGIFAWRPAPLQVSFLGFPGTSGADYIDYVIGDRWVTPLAHADQYTERIAQMPLSYQPNDSRRARPEACTRAQAGLPEGPLVLGAFNQAFKLTEATFDVWMDILKLVPDSLLWLLEDNPQASRNLRREAEARGVPASRLYFAPRLPYVQNLARLPLIDLMLDNWPCNAHTTAADALWMGVPLLTVQGAGFAARVASSLLHALDLPELVCCDARTYADRAVALLRDPARRVALRQHLAQVRQSSSLFDGACHARGLEALYERMLARAVAGATPSALAAAS